MRVALNGLLPEFRIKIDSLIKELKTSGFRFEITFALRTPLEQAKLWRQGRPTSLINKIADDLESRGYDYLAECLHLAGPQKGKRVTNALPGESWHQYGQAVDFMAYDDSGPIENSDHPAYDLLALKAQNLSLTTGQSWGDGGHVQFSKLGKPQYDLKTINDLMKQKFTTTGD